MSHYKKLYEKIKNNTKDVSFEELDKLLTKVGGLSEGILKEDLVITLIVILI